MDGQARERVMLKPMSCRSNPNASNTMPMVCDGVSVMTRTMDAHNMITTIMNTAA